MPEQDEFRVTLSLAQMAAILEHEPLSPYEITSNRIIGSLRLVGGIVELAGAGVLCAVPEPTMISKVGCIAIGIHASDQLAAGAHQLVTGRETDSYAFKAGMTAAEVMGVSRSSGQIVGLSAEFAVPITTASLFNAFRVSSVQAGRMTVAVSEQPLHAPTKSIGGHTIKSHNDKTLAQLQRRLRRSKNVEAMSTFNSVETAEWAVSQTLRAHKLKIQMASKLPFLLEKRRLTVSLDLSSPVGWGVKRGAPEVPVQMSRVKVVIEFNEYNKMPFYILTSYPVP